MTKEEGYELRREYLHTVRISRCFYQENVLTCFLPLCREGGVGGWGSRFNSAWKEVLQSGGYCGAGNLHKLGTKYILQSPINGDFSTPGPYLAKQNGQQKTLVFPLQSN